MTSSLIVISDLHLGGAQPTPGNAGFQMCTRAGRELLAQLIRSLAGEFTARNPDYQRRLLAQPAAADASAPLTLRHDIHLIIAGDIVDYLAEAPLQAFTDDEQLALTKLQQAMENSPEVWPALRAFVQAGGALTLLLGNHDIELSLAKPRRWLLQTLGPGRVELIYDNQALAIGDVLIEHGNRYDPWNCVPHNTLREVRSRLSRNEATPTFRSLPGSRLVVDVMNDFKQTSKFVDLLKPELSAAIPLLAGLQPQVLSSALDVAHLAWESGAISHLGESGAPLQRDYVAYRDPTVAKASGALRDTVASELAADFGAAASSLAQCVADAAAEVMPTKAWDASSTLKVQPPVDRSLAAYTRADTKTTAVANRWHDLTSKLRDWLDIVSGGKHVVLAARADDFEDKVGHLTQALQHLATLQHEELRTDLERAEYLRPAEHAIRSRGFSVVVYGHTHLAKRVYVRKPQDGDDKIAGVYLNTGTWVDLLFIPAELANLAAGEAAAKVAQLCRERGNDEESPLRRRVPTYARIEMSDTDQVLRGADGAPQADLYLFPSGIRLPSGRLDKLDTALQTARSTP